MFGGKTEKYCHGTKGACVKEEDVTGSITPGVEEGGGGEEIEVLGCKAVSYTHLTLPTSLRV